MQQKTQGSMSFWRSLAVGLGLFALLSTVAWIIYTDRAVRTQFEGRRWALPARVFARPLDIYPGRRLQRDDLVTELDALGYRRVDVVRGAGQYHPDDEGLKLGTRGFRFSDKSESPQQVSIRFEGGTIAALEGQNGASLSLMRMEPLQIGKIYPVHNEDRIIVQLKDVPPTLLQALLAIEDRNFYHHRGVNPLAILRAFVANLKAGKIAQGGSTLTQQLVKNFYLTRERTLNRKLNEFLMAILLEVHYEKYDILEAYLNEIFLGQDGPNSVHGFGLAAQFYFGQPLAELQTQQLALLVGLTRGASFYDPRRHPDRALKRRNLVLEVMMEQGLLSPDETKRLQRIPLQVLSRPHTAGSRFPAFMDLVRRQLVQDYREEDLRSEGLQIFTTLDPVMQLKGERALSDTLSKLEKQQGWKPETLEGAVIVTQSSNGEICAVVGGRDPSFAGFNRVLNAKRQIGSLVKPAVYLTALMQPDRYNLITRLLDEPVRVRDHRGHWWEPENYTHRSHGQVPLHTALAHSYNQATVRLGMDLGISRVVETLHELGVEEAIAEYPSLLLGTLDLTPLQVTQMYQTFAGGGFRIPLRAIRGVMAQNGTTLNYYGLSVRQAFKPSFGFLMNQALTEVVERGTASAARDVLHERLPLAGKTGTTNEMRDSWFAGYGSNLLGVVWVGRDDNMPAGLTGATGALRVWTDIMRRIEVEPLEVRTADGVEWQWVDVATGARTDPQCNGAERRPFVVGHVPDSYVPCPPAESEPGEPWRVEDLFR